jgi:hypothetical protein
VRTAGRVLALLALGASGIGAAEPVATAAEVAAAEQLRDAALRSDEAWALVSSLTTTVGPRLAGTPGDRAAVEWAVEALASGGFANVRRSEVVVPRWVRGEAQFELLDPVALPMVTAALGGSVGTGDEGLTAELLRVESVDALRALPAGVARGRIVYFAGRTARTRDGSGFARAVRARTEGPSAAAAVGAVGVVIRSIGTSDDRIAHTGTLVYNIAQTRIPAVAISNPDADLLERRLASGRPLRARLRVTARDLPQQRSANVIAEIPGTDRAGEIVLIGAHLDSWDLGHGALDNGAGVAIAIAAARLIGQSAVRPRRTIRVVLFANEEYGLSGSGRYVADELESLARHAFALEADMGAGPVFRLSARVSSRDWALVQQIHRVVGGLGVELGSNDATGGADTTALRRRGVPILMPQLDATRYFDVHHSANDTLDKVDPQALRQSVAVFAVAAFLAARFEDTPGRLPAEATR